MTLARLKLATHHQLRLQHRHGIHAVYALVTALYIALLRFAPPSARPGLSALLIASDPAFLGFFFIGGMMFLERNDRTHQAIAVTPLTPAAQLAARIISLSLVGAIAAAILAIAAGLPPASALLIAAIVLIASPANIIIGVLIAARFDAVNRFMAFAGLGLAPLAIPMLPLADIHPPQWLCWLIPTHPAVVAIAGATGALPASHAAIAAAIAALLAWDLALWPLGLATWEKHMLGHLHGIPSTDEA